MKYTVKIIGFDMRKLKVALSAVGVAKGSEEDEALIDAIMDLLDVAVEAGFEEGRQVSKWED